MNKHDLVSGAVLLAVATGCATAPPPPPPPPPPNGTRTGSTPPPPPGTTQVCEKERKYSATCATKVCHVIVWTGADGKRHVSPYNLKLEHQNPTIVWIMADGSQFDKGNAAHGVKDHDGTQNGKIQGAEPTDGIDDVAPPATKAKNWRIKLDNRPPKPVFKYDLTFENGGQTWVCDPTINNEPIE